MIFFNIAKRCWGFYTRFFRTVHFDCEIRPGNDTVTTRTGWSSTGFDPQLEILAPGKLFPPGWYRLTYDADHPSGDALFIPKIYPLATLEKAKTFPMIFPKGYGEKNSVSRFLATKRQAVRQSKDALADTGDTENHCATPMASVINLRPHLPGRADHLFQYGFEAKGFRFDPFDLDYRKTWAPFYGPFSLTDFRLTYLGVFPFLLFSIRNTIVRADQGYRFLRVQTALQLLRKRGKSALINWLGHKSYLKTQSPFSPTTWYSFFSQTEWSDATSEDVLSRVADQLVCSLFVFAEDSDPNRLVDSVNSGLSQTYSKLTLVILTTEMSSPAVSQQSNRLAQKHTNIQVRHCKYQDFRQILEQDKSDFICMIRSGDKILPHGVAALASALGKSSSDIAYADEAILTTSGRRIHKILLRPAFCLDHFLHEPCIGLMTAIRRKLLTAGGLITDCTNVETLNERLMLDALVSANNISHVPDILLERLRSSAKSEHLRLPTSSIHNFLKNHGFEDATVETTATPSLYSIRYNHPLPGKTVIIIPTKNHHDILRIAVESLTRTVPKELYDLVVVNHDSDDPNTVAYLHEIAKAHRVINYQGAFNFSKINNFAVTQLDEAYGSFLFMNNDIQATKEGWLESMRDKLGQRHVGVVGAVLLYPPNSKEKDVGTTKEAESLGSNSIQSQDFQKINSAIANADLSRCQIQHAGVHLGVGIAEHWLKYEQYQDAYLEGSGLNPAVPNPVTRSFSAVTAACLLIRKEVFSGLKGFDETLAVGFQDVDLCLRAGNEGYKVLVDAEAVLFHHESASRNTNDFFERDPHPQDTTNFRYRYVHDIGRDPFYHPMLSTTTPQFRPLRSMNRPRADIRVVANLGLEPFEP
jgi:O-antigen biosynthesis protein